MTVSVVSRYFSFDLGLRRLTAAGRAGGTWLIVVGSLAVCAALLRLPMDFILPGLVVVSVTTMCLGMDLDPRRRFVPLMLSTATGVLGFWAGSLVLGDSLLTTVVFFAFGLGTLASTAAGARGTILALVAVGSFYAATLVRPEPADVAVYFASIALASVVSAVLLGVLLRENPRREQARLLRSVQATAVTLIASLPEERERAVRRRRTALTRVVMLCRTQIAADPSVWRRDLRAGDGDALVSWELRFGRAVERSRGSGGDSNSDTRSDVTALLADPVVVPWRPRGHPMTDGGDVRRLPASSTDHSDGLPAPLGGRSLLSTAVQLLTACLLALIVSQLVDPVHWFWGVLAALVMLFGTSSAADAVGKGLRRVIGTAAGLPLGLVLAAVTDDSPVWAMAVVVVALFAQQYLADLAYGWSVVALTTMLGVLFGQTGSDPLSILDSRLVLTGLGAAIGILVAVVVLPTRTGALLGRRADDALAAADATLDAIARVRPAAVVVGAGREATKRFLLLEAEAGASRRGWPFGRGHRDFARLVSEGAVVELDLRRVVEEYRVRFGDGHPQGMPVASARERIKRLRAALGTAHARAPGPRPEYQRTAESATGDTRADESLERLDTSLSALQQLLLSR